MAVDLEDRTLNGALIKEGFVIVAAIPDEHLPESLTGLLVEFARGKYRDMRIVPGDIALDKSPWKLEKPSHLVYVKDNPHHPEYRSDLIRLVMPMLVHRATGEYKNTLPIGSVE